MASTKPYFCALIVLLGASGVFCSPLKDFFESVRKDPLTTYQCYRNGSSLEDPSAIKLSVSWSGSGLPDHKVDCIVSFSLPGSEGKKTFHVSAEYVPQKDYVILTAGEKNVNLHLLDAPYNGKAYFFKQVDTSTGDESFKIYDISATCENAHALRKIICTEPCGLQNTAQ
ncbi:uncharacterized protein LOC119455624 [Dermacentor silvarum]|uniref:uncharacterized protein LOC119455624 n=1 Tax=Dermacentor silvarum TaxID=543639 RepID=UPI00189C3944|nr:uncharacterized protein LOC119455624 [Dermacentor silvarum]